MMKKYFPLLVAVALVLLFLPILLLYALPMSDETYQLSPPTDDTASVQAGDNAWTVYTADNQGNMVPLTAHDKGGYTGLDYPGQTIYYSRPLYEELDSPTLQIDANNCAVSVFLDGELLYTDCPELDNRIGWLTLPMLEEYRSDPVVLHLPLDCIGKTLTIAQATPAGDTHTSDAVYPCKVTLYCGYAYESNLIATSSHHLIPAALLFSLAVAILIIFVWSSFFGQVDIGLPLLSLLAFLMMSSLMLHAPFFIYYFGEFPVNLAAICFYCSVTVLLGFLSCRMETFRSYGLALMAVQFLSVLADLWIQYNDLKLARLPASISLIALLLLCILALLEWRQGSPFFHKFCLTLCICAVIAAGAVLISAIVSPEVRLLLHTPILFFLHLCMLLSFIGSLAATAVQTAAALIRAQAERSILLAREQFARSSYDSLYLQTEHTMELRHDMRKHLTILRTLLAHQEYEQASGYVDNLVAENQTIRPIVRCGNQMLDIILNSKLDEAMQQNVRVQVLYAEAPASLPLSDTELTSLMMNVMDNAVHAALCSSAADRFIELELRVNGQFLLFRCANNAQKSESHPTTDATSVLSPHGYGLKIINRILARYGSVSRIESDAARFQISFALPLQ